VDWLAIMAVNTKDAMTRFSVLPRKPANL
jgi:hypothetical protein